jgi:hypothetical protein
MKQDYLDQRMIDLGDGTYVTLRDFAQNALVTGANGGGKSSGPGAHILAALARSDAGGIILCAKSSEADDVHAVLKKAGREHSVIRWNGRNGGFNFLAWALARMGQDGIGSVVEYLMRIVEIVRNASPLRGHDGDSFWLDEFKRAIRHLLPVLSRATGTVRMQDILSFIRSAPTSMAQFSDPAWQATRPFFFECFRLAADRIDAQTGRQLREYWEEFAKMDGKLRSSILATFTMLDRFCHGWLKEATTGETSLVPALCFHGAIIILDMSRTTMGEDGVVCQMIFKDAFQTEVLARNSLPPPQRERFVFCYADEAQEFWSASRDAEFFAMSRSSLCSTIYLTQSLNSIYAKMGGTEAHARAHHAIACMGIRVFCGNNCTTTNSWASETIGKAVQRRASFNENRGSSTSFGTNMGMGTNEGSNSSFGGSSSHSSGSGGGSSSSGSSWSIGSSYGTNDSRGRNRGGGTSEGSSWGYSEAVDWIVEPGFFASGLRTGGPANGFRVTALWTQMGRIFPATGLPFMHVEFQQ